YGCMLPLQIGSKVLEEAYNNFLEQNSSTRYKFQWDNGNVYIVDMANPEHGCAVLRLINYFNVPNGGIDDDPPIDIALRSCKNSLIIITFYVFPTAHYDPSNNRTKIGADIAICPHIAHVQNPLNPGPPPGDVNVHQV